MCGASFGAAGVTNWPGVHDCEVERIGFAAAARGMWVASSANGGTYFTYGDGGMAE